MSNIYACTALTGGASGALDSIDGALLSDMDSAMVTTAEKVYHYSLDADSGASESSPDVIAPDTNPGTKRWVLVNVQGGGLTYEVVTTGQTTQNGRGYLLNPSANITITLHASPNEGDTVAIVDAYNMAETYVITISGNGAKIEGSSEDLIVDVAGSGFTLVYVDATRGWEIASEIGAGSEPTVQFDYSNHVDRGDHTEHDYELTDLTADGTWRDLSFSTVAPSNAIALVLKVTITADTAGRTFIFRKNGNSNAYNGSTCRVQVASVYNDMTCVVPCDANQTVEYYMTSATWAFCTVNCLGWFTDGSATVSVSDYQIGSYKNKLINGNFDIWQRGTSFAAPTSGDFTADRWGWLGAGDMVHTVSRSTDIPTESSAPSNAIQSTYSLKVLVTTADASIGSTDTSYIRQKIEGYNFAPMQGKRCTLSFWVKSNVTGTYCISLIGGVSSYASYVAEYTINSSGVWEKKTITLDFDAGFGDWTYETGSGLQVNFVLDDGSNSQTTKDTWVSGAKVSTTSQVNFSAAVDNYFNIAQVQFEVGASASPFEGRNIAQELALCQRYYEKSFPYGTTPAHGESPLYGAAGMIANATDIYRDIYYRVEKRITPTVTFYASGYIGTTKWGWYDGSTWYEADANVVTASNSTGYTIKLSDTGLTKDVTLVCGNWTADAEF